MVRWRGVFIGWVFGQACSLTAAAGFAADPAPTTTSGLRVEYAGAITLPAAAPTKAGRQVALTGLSGITWLGADRYIAVMDNSHSLLRLRLALAADGSPAEASGFEVVDLAATHDFEDVAPDPVDGARIYLCEEDTPAIRCFRLTSGAADGQVSLPAVFQNRRANRGPEALALDPDRKHLWTANEEAFTSDGPAAGPDLGTVVRIARLQLPTGRPVFQAAYPVDPPHQIVSLVAGPRLSGVVAIVALGWSRLLVLERSAGPGLPPFENRIYLVDTSQKPDASGVPRDLVGRPDLLLEKTLVWSGSLGVNVEGLCLGPKLGDNRRVLVAIADNGGLDTPTHVPTFLLSAAITSP